MRTKLFHGIFLMLFAALSLSAAAQSQDNFLWPIQGKEAGEDILYRPQEYIGSDQNFANLYIGAPLGTVVVAPADGTVTFFGVGYQPSIGQIVMDRPDGTEPTFDAMIAAFQKEEKDISVPPQYVCGVLILRLADGRKLEFSGLRGDVTWKTGMAVKRGDIIGTVGYAYKEIKEPHINLSVIGHDSQAADPMTPFGLKSTFLPPKKLKATDLLTQAQALEDFGILTACLEEAYPSLYDVISREEWAANDSTTRVRLAAADEISYADFYDVVVRFLNRVHDSHLELLTLNPAFETMDFYLPRCILNYQGDSLYIAITSPELSAYKGRRVAAVDGEDAVTRLARLRPQIPGADGDNRNWADCRLISSWTLAYGDSIRAPRTTVLTLDNGETVTDKWQHIREVNIFRRFVRVDTVDYHRRESRNYNYPYAFSQLNDSTGYFSLSHFDLGQVQIEQLQDSLRPLFRLPNLVVDLRHNRGGNGDVMQRLLSWFLNAPGRLTGSYQRVTKPGPFRSFAYALNYDSTMVLFPEARRVEGKDGYIMNDSAVALMPDTAFHYGGRLYVLTDETSTSAATLFPATLVRNHRAVTVGRETRSGYHYMTAAKFVQLRLPHSLLMFRIPLVQCVFDPDTTARTPWNRGLLPDYPVPVTVDELQYSSRDTVLNHALRLIAEGKYLGPDPFPQEVDEEATDWPMKATIIVIVLLVAYIILRLTLFRKRTN